MDKNSQKYIPILIIPLLSCLLFYHLSIDRSKIEFDIEVSSPSYLEIFWADAKEGYTENRMSSVFIHPCKHHYSLTLQDLDKIHSLRIDPQKVKGPTTIRQIRLEQQGFQTVSLQTPDDFKNLKPKNQITDLALSADGVHFTASDEDPFFEYFPPKVKSRPNWFEIIFQLMVVFLGSALILLAVVKTVQNYAYVPLFLAAITIAVFTMCLQTAPNTHPDEYVHISAVDYYQDHWLPPAADNPEIGNTYSLYGISRLNHYEIYYLIAGKVERILGAAFAFPNPCMTARMVNVLMLTVILIMTINSITARILAVPLLISPQIWYIFSYSNSDAFALFICFLVAYELVKPDSIFYRSLKRPMIFSNYFFMLYPVILLSLFWLSKVDFYPFIAFAFCYLIFRRLFNRDSFQINQQMIIRFFTITIASGILAMAYIGTHHYVNNFNRAQKIAEMEEIHAAKRFKPSTALESQNFSLSLKDRGISLKQLINQYHWLNDTFQSSFGVYGYLSIKSPTLHYNLVKITGTLLALYLFSTILLSLNGEYLINTLTLLVFSTVIFSLSLYHSWVIDFQPQGRYLFSILPMVSMLLVLIQPKLNRTYLFAGVCSMAVLGLISFIGSGIMHTPKILLVQ